MSSPRRNQGGQLPEIPAWVRFPCILPPVGHPYLCPCLREDPLNNEAKNFELDFRIRGSLPKRDAPATVKPRNILCQEERRDVQDGKTRTARQSDYLPAVMEDHLMAGRTGGNHRVTASESLLALCRIVRDGSDASLVVLVNGYWTQVVVWFVLTSGGSRTRACPRRIPCEPNPAE